MNVIEESIIYSSHGNLKNINKYRLETWTWFPSFYGCLSILELLEMMISYLKRKLLMLHFKNKKIKNKHHFNLVDNEGGNYIRYSPSCIILFFLFFILWSCQTLINLYASSITWLTVFPYFLRTLTMLFTMP